MNMKTFISVLLFSGLFIFSSTNPAFAQSSGFIFIKSNPTDAEVFINGKAMGTKTPFQKELGAGDYKFALKYAGYHTLEGEFTIQKGQTVTRDLKLKPAYGSIIVRSEPSGAAISLDGVASYKKTPDTLVNVSSGQHQLVISKEMYSDKIDTVTVQDEIRTDVFLDLETNYGTVGIIAKPDALISIDGEKVGFGRYVAQLPPGKHKIEVTRDNYYPQQQEIIFYKGQEDKLKIPLKPIVGTLSVMVDPPETSIYLNSVYYGMSPKMIDTLLIGEYDLELKKEGFGIFRQHIKVEENKTIVINKNLQQGKLIKVKSTPDSALVYYNGSVVGTTPAEFVVKDGSNKLILKKKYFADKEAFITVDRDDQDFNYNLEAVRTSVNISIETKPDQAGIKLNEKAFMPEFSSDSTSRLVDYFGITPYHFQIPIGKYNLIVEKKGFKSINKEILIDKQEDFSLNLEPVKYRKKGNAILLSLLWPGAGQSYLERGSATFLMGFVGYGAIAGAVYEYKVQRNQDLFNYSEFAAITVWGANLIWTIATKSEVNKLKNVQFSLLNTANGSIPMFGWKSNF